MILKAKKLSDTAILPTKGDITDAAFDLYSDEDVHIYAGQQKLISTSIALEIPEGYAGLIWPRSGLSAKNGIDVLAGVIDSNYRGEIKVCLLLNSYVYSDLNKDVYYDNCDYHIKKGDRIAQIVIQEVPQFIIQETDELSSSTRGEKGFGSSGR